MKRISSLKSIVTLHGKPHHIAGGFALGSFIGMMPIPGFQMVVSLVLAVLLRISKKAACIGVFNTNILTGAFIFGFNLWLGKTILGISLNFTMPDKIGFDFIKLVFSAGADVFLSMVIGGIITGIISAVISYYILINILKRRNSEERK